MSATKIAICNQKGGAGKTTTAICLAQELIQRGKRVLFIDTDSQCNSTAFYEAKTEDEYTLVDILCGDADASLCIQHTEKGDIIPSDKQLEDAENKVRIDERRFTHLRRSLKSVENDYDYIIIDTPPFIGVLLKNVLATAEFVVIPAEESGWALQGLMDFANAVELAKENNQNLVVAGILTVKTKQRTRNSAEIATTTENLAAKMDTKRFETKIRESTACVSALTRYFVPLHEYDPKSTTYRDYRDFTDELLARIGRN